MTERNVCVFVVDELHIQWEVLLESETKMSSVYLDGALEKRNVPQANVVSAAADHQVCTSVISSILIKASQFFHSF